ncbi:hypothetical protein O7632_15800 [Solwaraspora sp. WMMD406]|uniref:hypothetical protein n=1 Tax=Solwaraspora sp. WMMD406 TaxID=3016095 RepID=UPI00241758BB|nr:hypothetical protein [Solwaraspora sp. WMMD406]MDG4765549.1 hypothetical protein [Solwaraspora sp. WMMD406]
MIARLRYLDEQLKRQLLTVVGVLVLFGVTVSAVGGLFLRSGQEPDLAARTAAVAFLDRLTDGPQDAAYDLLCTTTQADLSRTRFLEWSRGLGIEDYWIGAVRPIEAASRPELATVGVRITTTTGVAQVIMLEVAVNRGSWRVCAGPFAR